MQIAPVAQSVGSVQLVRQAVAPSHAKGVQSVVPPGTHWPLALHVEGAVNVVESDGQLAAVQAVPGG
jgi:hypothetical protein